jgi:hypothetical protein
MARTDMELSHPCCDVRCNAPGLIASEQLSRRSPAGFILEIDISERLFMGEAVVAPAKTAVLPVWACGLGRTLLGVEISNAY